MPDTAERDDAQTVELTSDRHQEVDIKSDSVATEASLSVPENDHDGEEYSSNVTPTARSVKAEGSDVQDESNSASDVTIKRRQKRLSRPYYYIGGNNGTHIVDEFLNSLGWERITDRNREDYKLKWCEIKSHNNYCTFKEGEQLCYQIPNNKVLTTKIGLLTSLQEYDRVMNKVKKGKPRIMKYQDFFPETYRMDVKEERELFCEIYKDGEIWISKPTGLNQGKGIYLIRNRDDIAKFQGKMAEVEEEVQTTRKLPFKIPMARIVQRYVTNPLLLNGKKFDVRNYMLIASTQPFVVFYRDGYCRLTCLPYDEQSTDLTSHLTNQFMQKKNPLYQEVKDETVWSMDRFNDYVNQNHMKKNDLPQDWVHTVLRKRCQQIMLHCFQSVRHKLECRLGFFDLYGCDFLVDDDFKIHLLEFNCNPALHTNCELLKEVIPSVVIESLKLSLEIFNKSKAKERIMPLAAQEHVSLLYNGDLIEAEERREKMRTIAEARKRARSAQRRKKFMANFNLRYSYQGQRVPDGENEGNTSTSNATSSSSNTTTHTSVTNSTIQNIVNKPHPRLPQSTEVTHSNAPPMATISVSGSRSHTSLSTTQVTHTHSPSRVTGSRSMPNIVQKKPFYAGGTVPSRPFSSPRFQRSKKAETRHTSNSTSQPQKSSADDETVTEKSVAASLDAKVKAYQATEASTAVIKVHLKQVYSKDRTEKKSPDPDGEYKQQNRGRPRERIKHIRTKSQEDQVLESGQSECDSPNDSEKVERIIAANRKLLEAMTSSAIQAPSAKLPSSYHSKGNIDIEFSKKYLAGIASKKNPNICGKVNGMIKTFKAPLPSAISFTPRDGNIRSQIPSEQFLQQQKMQYRSPTTVRVRQTLQATTCTLEIGPKARRGLVAIPAPVTSTTPVNQGNKNPLQESNAVTKLRMTNATSASLPLSFSENDDTITKTETDDPHQNLQSVANLHPFESGALEAKTKATCVDSSTQTPISNYALSSEEKVIWRLRAKVGATSSSTRLSNRPPVPSSEASTRSALPVTFTGVKTYMAHQGPRYVAVRPTLGNGVTLVISPPPLVSGKNMLPAIRESRNNSDSFPHESDAIYFNRTMTSQLSQHSQTPNSDGEDDIPTSLAMEAILDDITQAKLEDNSEKWMAPG